jgi:hypothetical protein
MMLGLGFIGCKSSSNGLSLILCTPGGLKISEKAICLVHFVRQLSLAIASASNVHRWFFKGKLNIK